MRAESAGPDTQAEMEKLRASRDALAEKLAKLTAAAKSAPAAAAEPEKISAQTCGRAIARLLKGQAIRFEPNSAEISNDGKGLIQKLAGAAKPCVQSDTLALVISGHTDNQGSPKSNLDLSKRRAESVRQAFAALGLDGRAMTARGFGENRPLADNQTEEGRIANRRIAFDWIAK